ncbi:MAG: hypothetical protein LBP89_02425 [Helicobacteraceae bacterium]|jgi:hypothetical protein|nr:hypothetical protein [Helicobacteraceae bacterium]
MNVNRIVGFIYSGDVQNNFALDTMTTNLSDFSDAGAPSYHGTDKDDNDLKSQSTYESDLGWLFDEGNDANPWVWGAFGGYPYPTLYWQTVEP